MSSNSLNKTSKFLSLVLRHKPEVINLTLDKQGWASVAELIEKAQPQLVLTFESIQHLVTTNDKQRFSLSADKRYIRANQGHSIQVDLQLQPTEPPTVLYHGSATRFLASIKQGGLVPKQRQYVHLSSDIKTATAVGKRYGKPVIIEVAATNMYQQGFEFFLSENGVWLTAQVPVDFLSVCD